MITKRDVYGTWKSWLICIPLIIGPPLFMLYCFERFQLVDQNDPWLLRSAFVGYAVMFIALLVIHGKLFPWGRSLPTVKWGAIFLLPLLGAMPAIGVFLLGNALLDSSQRQYTVRLIGASNTAIEYQLTSENKIATREELTVRRGTPPLARGTRVVLEIRRGFFGSPWISGYRIEK